MFECIFFQVKETTSPALRTASVATGRTTRVLSEHTHQWITHHIPAWKMIWSQHIIPTLSTAIRITTIRTTPACLSPLLGRRLCTARAPLPSMWCPVTNRSAACLTPEQVHQHSISLTLEDFLQLEYRIGRLILNVLNIRSGKNLRLYRFHLL